jgi:hypothetical protein
MSQEAELLEIARRVSRSHAKQLMAKANVVGVGVGLGESGGFAVVVMVKRKLARELLGKDDLVPEQIEGIPVEVREVGELSAGVAGPEPSGSIAKGAASETD